MHGLDFLGAELPIKPSARIPISLSAGAVALVAGAIGAAICRKHPVLAFLSASALASNAHALATKNRTLTEAGKRMGKHVVAVAGSLALQSHPAVGYIAGAVAADLLLDGTGGGIVEEWAHYAGVRDAPERVEIIDVTPIREESRVQHGRS